MRLRFRERIRTLAGMAACGAILAGHAAPARAASCDVAAASPWISRWLAAWDLASREILRLPDSPPPDIVFYDSSCVYTTSSVTAPGVPAIAGPALRGAALAWRATTHGDTLTLPNGKRLPVALLSFADHDRASGPFFVMAAPSYWKQAIGAEGPGLTGVFLHEFAHTRQIRGLVDVIGPIDSAWAYPDELDDDAVQTHFGSDSVYVAAYLAERDLLYRAAAADSLAEVRALAKQALDAMRRRHARWFTGDRAVFATLDDTFLSLEGAGQWTASAWLAHPAGGRLDRDAAVAKMLGRRRRWSQDEGLALFLVVDRLMPGWPALVFGPSSMGATALLERAIGR
jgi:hypothetical protein